MRSVGSPQSPYGLTVNTVDPGDIRAGTKNEGQVDILAVFLCVISGSQRGDQFSTPRSEGAPTRCNEGFYTILNCVVLTNFNVLYNYGD